jgi:hypothetical protein
MKQQTCLQSEGQTLMMKSHFSGAPMEAVPQITPIPHIFEKLPIWVIDEGVFFQWLVATKSSKLPTFSRNYPLWVIDEGVFFQRFVDKITPITQKRVIGRVHVYKKNTHEKKSVYTRARIFMGN